MSDPRSLDRPDELAPGVTLVPLLVEYEEQTALAERARAICRACPLVRPVMPQGAPFRLRHAAAGAGLWWSDAHGYRYVDRHPTTGAALPGLPTWVGPLYDRALAAIGLEDFKPPNHVGVLVYDDGGGLGMHVDRQEHNDNPIVTIALGASCLFKTEHRSSAMLSGDAILLWGPGRHERHGVAKIEPSMFVGPGVRGDVRVSLTIRRLGLEDAA